MKTHFQDKTKLVNSVFDKVYKKYDFKNAWLSFDGRLGLTDFANKNSTLKLVQKKIPNKNILNKFKAPFEH